jgi:hypothetical protein
MSRVLIVHVGPHKTGTTYLQRRLVADRDLLLRRLGVVYPRTGQDVLFGHHSLAPLFRKAAEGSPELGRLKAELNAGGVGLLSSEGFSKLKRRHLTGVREYFHEFDVRAVAYLRVRSELLLSYWSESVKHGNGQGFPEFLAEVLAAPDASPLVNQAMLLDRLAAVLGKSNLQVLIYRRGVDLYTEFIERVIGSASFASESRGLNEPVNASLPMYATECLRFLNHLADADRPQDPTFISTRFMGYYLDPGSAADRRRLRALFDAMARTVDLAGVDRDFDHLDREMMTRYALNVRNAAPNGGFPESNVTGVQYLQDSEALACDDFRHLLARIYQRIVR